jgi:V/A-type H+-transporting ATPase subunit A
MPAEEGFPAYLASRLSGFYERAGYVENLNGSEGSVTIIGAVSPQGADFSEPVTQNTKRFIRCFWALDKTLAYARHYPAIAWLTSYSEYVDDLSMWYEDNIDKNFVKARAGILSLLQEESSLMEIVKLIGEDVLPDEQKAVLEIARVIRLGFLQQNAYHKEDTYVPLIKQYKMMELILYYFDKIQAIVSKGILISEIRKSGLSEEVIRVKYNIANDDLAAFDKLKKRIDEICAEIIKNNS